MVRLFSYVVVHDFGFAPNPFYGWCTVAVCKPAIRRTARHGDWLLGTGSKTTGLDGRIVYAMRVEEILGFDAYWDDPRFARKRPRRDGNIKQLYGDNIYHHGPDESWQQEDSRHSLKDGSPNQGHIRVDTSTDRVLASETFIYFGGTGPVVPNRLRHDYAMDVVHSGRGHRCDFSDVQRDATIDWIRSLGEGVRSDPSGWR